MDGCSLFGPDPNAHDGLGVFVKRSLEEYSNSGRVASTALKSG